MLAKIVKGSKNMGKVLRVREVGDPILEKICEKVDIKNIDNEILDIIEDLKQTLEFGVGLGIAAPQIGINKRIIVVGAKKENTGSEKTVWGYWRPSSEIWQYGDGADQCGCCYDRSDGCYEEQ